MNKIDLENIKKELAKREAANYKWEDGGELTKDDIMLRTTKELNKLVKDFNNSGKTNAEQEIKKLVDDIFEKFSDDPEDNIIILGACNYYDDSRCASECDHPLSHIDFDGFDHEYNKLAYPIGRKLQAPCYDNGYKGEKKYYQLMDEASKIVDKFSDIGLQPIFKYWDKENEAINECWFGVHGITKDYRIVAFVIRDDGMLCDEESFDTFYNSTLYTIK